MYEIVHNIIVVILFHVSVFKFGSVCARVCLLNNFHAAKMIYSDSERRAWATVQCTVHIYNGYVH